MIVLAVAALFAVVGPVSSSGLVPDLPVGPAPDGTSDCVPDPVRFRLAQLGVVEYTEEPDAGTWQTWFIGPEDIAVPPPPAAGSPQDVQELLEVKQATMSATSNESTLAAIMGEGPAGRFWTDLYLSLIVEHAAKDGAKNPPRLARQMAMIETALADAFTVVWHYKYCYLRPAPTMLDPTIEASVTVPPAPSYPSEHAAAAGVVATMFPHFFPCVDPENDPFHCEERPEFWDGQSFNATESRIWSGANYRSDIEAGFDIGVQVAQAVLADRATDNSNAVWDGTGWLQGDCNWKRNPIGHGGRGPVEPVWGNVRPFIMSSGSQFRAPPPPACDGPEYLAEYRDVFEASLTLTDRQRDVADYWEAGQGTVTPPGMNLEIALDKALQYELNTMRAQRVLAYEAVAVADAGIASWDTKFHYWFDRPIQAIRRLNMDTEAGLCDTVGEQADYTYGGCWHSHATTPPFPGYVSGHSTFTGAGQETLKYFFPQDDREFNAYQTEAAMARFYGGIHFRHDNDQGLEMGRSIAHLLWERAAADGADA